MPEAVVVQAAGAEAAVIQAAGSDAAAVGDLLPYMDAIQMSMDSIQTSLQAIDQAVWVCVAVLVAAAFAYFAVRWLM